MHEELYEMRKELAELIKSDSLLASAVKEVNRIDLIKGSLLLRNSDRDKINIDAIIPIISKNIIIKISPGTLFLIWVPGDYNSKIFSH